MGDETVTQCGREGPNAPVPRPRWQQCGECVRGVCGVTHDAGRLADAARGVNVRDGGQRHTDDLLRCPHYPLQGTRP